jgi:ankyrin repeat protein
MTQEGSFTPDAPRLQLDDKWRAAVFAGDLEGVKQMVAAGQLEARDSEGNTPLACACRGTKYDVVKYLLEQGADPNAANDRVRNTPLVEAALCHQGPIVKLLLEHGADPDKTRIDNQTPLMMAVFAEDLESIGLLIEHGADVTIQSKNEGDAIGQAYSKGKVIVDFIGKAVKERDDRIAREKKEREFRENLSGIGAVMDGGLAKPVPIAAPLRFARRS